MEDIKKRKERNDKGKGQNGNEKKKDECEKILDNVVKELVEQMKEAPDKQVDEFTRAFAPFHTSNGLNNLALENSLSNCREVCEERCFKFVNSQNEMVEEIDEYHANLPRGNEFRNQISQLKQKTFTADELKTLIEVEEKRITHSKKLIDFYNYKLNEFDYFAQAWSIVLDECEQRSKKSFQKKKVQVLSQDPDL